MKQNITPEQLNELSDKMKERLAQYCGRHQEWLLAQELDDSTQWTKNVFLPLLSIGQMIEFLDEHGMYDIHNVSRDVRGRVWKIQMKSDQFYGDSNFEGYFELCDALWQAVKEILNEEVFGV